jgi:4-amino-4-deoxy-L-arabinose transferase-like glycosyltransferase
MYEAFKDRPFTYYQSAPDDEVKGTLTAWACRHDPCLFSMLLIVVGATGVRWLWLYRHGQPYDIDEAGYLSFALTYYRGLFLGGLGGWWTSVLGPSFQAPLLMAATTPAFLIGGPNPIVGLAVPMVFGLVAVGATFSIGRRIGGPRVGWLAGLLALGAPILLNYSRSYNFAIAATATLTLALLAFVFSDNLQRRGWSAALGLFIGLTALARTMTLAFLPGLLVSIVVAAAAGPERKRRAVNALTAVAVSLVVAWPWYSKNWSLVYEYLTNFGYGHRATEYGTAAPFFSFRAWQMTSQNLGQLVYLPCLVLLGSGAGALAAVVAREIHRRGVRPVALAAVRSPLMPSVLVVVEGLTALTSTRNKGTGFAAPLIPAMAICAASGVARLPARSRRVFSTVAVLVVALNVMAASDLRSPLAKRRVVLLPVLGWTPVSDGRGTLQQYESYGTEPPLSAPQPLTRHEGEEWVAANAATAARLRASNGPLTAFGFRHRLFNVNSVQLEELTAGSPPLPFRQVAPVDTGDTAEGYAAWLKNGDAAAACTLLTATGVTNEIRPAITTQVMEQAAVEAGFVRASSWTLPDGRGVSLWRRDARCRSTASGL